LLIANVIDVGVTSAQPLDPVEVDVEADYLIARLDRQH
jgi:hypothetical protein